MKPGLFQLAPASLFLALIVCFVQPILAAGPDERTVYHQTKAGTALIVAINDASGSVSFGSGFFVDGSGLLVTNAHVLDGHPRRLVYVHDSIYETPELVSVDPDSDLAALRIPMASTPLPLASELPDDGVSVIAVGYPRITDILQMGLTLHPTVFPVNVSGTVMGRSRTSNRPTPFIETTVPMNSGSSGGPLVRIETGEVLGMVVHTVPYVGQAKDRKGTVVGSVMLRAGINYSIPAPEIRKWLVSQRLAEAPTQSAARAESHTTSRPDDPTAVADSFYATAHLLHTIARVMKEDAELLQLAVAHYKSSLELQPQAAWRYHSLGLAQATLGRWDDAVDSYQMALAQRTDNAILLTDLGHALHRTKKTSQSITTYRSAIRLDSCSQRARTELGLIFMESEHWQEAIAEFSRVAECHTLSPVVSYHWGLALEHEGRHQDALKVWEPFLIADTSLLPPREKGIAEKIRERVEVLKKRSHAPDIAPTPPQTSSAPNLSATSFIASH